MRSLCSSCGRPLQQAVMPPRPLPLPLHWSCSSRRCRVRAFSPACPGSCCFCSQLTPLLLLNDCAAGATTAAPLLASGLVPLLKLLASNSDPPCTTTHPLRAALLSAPSAGATLITDTVNWLAAAAADDTAGLDAAWCTLQPFFAFVLLSGATYDSSSSSSGASRGAAGGLLQQQQQASSEGALAAARGLLLSQLLGLAGCDAAAAGLAVPLVLQQLAVWRSDSAADRCGCV